MTRLLERYQDPACFEFCQLGGARDTAKQYLSMPVRDQPDLPMEPEVRATHYV